MPVRKNHPEYEVKLKDWITHIIAELDEAAGFGGDDAPEIIEDYQAFSKKFSVRVIWSKWEDVLVAAKAIGRQEHKSGFVRAGKKGARGIERATR